MNAPPLFGYRVLELATILAGPAVGMFLAELGARVVKVENPTSGGDPTRGWLHPLEDGESVSAYFSCVNWGKRSLALDLSRQRDQLEPLLAEADILLMNFKPGDEAKLDLEPEGLLKRYPQLIIGWVTGYPDSSRTGFDALIQAESGFMAMNGPTGGPACKMPVAMIDLLAAHQLKEGLLLALWLRDRGQGGRLVRVSLWETALASLANQANNVLMAGTDPQPEGTEHPNLFPYGTILHCLDGDILLAVGSDRQFERLCGCLGAPQLSLDYPDNARRARNREQVRETLLQRSREKESQTLLEELWSQGVPAGRIQSLGQALQQTTPWQDGAARGLPSLAFSGFPPSPQLAAPPTLGQHNHDPWGPPSPAGAIPAESCDRCEPDRPRSQDSSGKKPATAQP